MTFGILPAPIVPLLGTEIVTRLSALAEKAAALVPRPDAPRVILLPGLPGTMLGRRSPPLDDVVWLDVEAIRHGRLGELAVDPRSPAIEPLELLAPMYLELQVHLRLAGWDVGVHPFDWRRSLVDLGAELRETLRAEKRPVQLVAHSYGGLVARAALAAGADNVSRVIMLGTPNHGTFATVQGIRGHHWVLRLLDALDERHDVAHLAEDIFNSFPSVYEQLPARSKLDGVDLYDAEAWPKEGPQPRRELLARAVAAQATIAEVRGDIVVIAGHGYPTVNRVTRVGGFFRYDGSTAGDGWVSTDGATLEGMPTYFVEAAHLGMPNHPLVIAAVLDLLSGPTTDKLSTARPEGRPIPAEIDASPGPPPFGGRRGSALTQADLADAFSQLFNVPRG